MVVLTGNTVVFGVPIEAAVLKNNGMCPAPIQKPIEYLRKVDGATVSGIFRISAAQPDVQQLKDAFNNGFLKCAVFDHDTCRHRTRFFCFC